MEALEGTKEGALLVWQHLQLYHQLQLQRNKETPKMCLLKATRCDCATPQGLSWHGQECYILPGCVSVSLRNELGSPLRHYQGTLQAFIHLPGPVAFTLQTGIWVGRGLVTERSES